MGWSLTSVPPILLLFILAVQFAGLSGYGYSRNYYSPYYRNYNYYQSPYYGYGSDYYSYYSRPYCQVYSQSCQSNYYSPYYNYNNRGYYNDNYYNYYRGGYQTSYPYGSFPVASWNRGVNPATGTVSGYGNVGWGNNLGAFFLSCSNCGRNG